MFIHPECIWIDGFISGSKDTIFWKLKQHFPPLFLGEVNDRFKWLLTDFKENYFLNWYITGSTFFKYICQVLTFTMNAHRNHGLWYAGWYRWLISKPGATPSQKECMRACYSSNLLATGSISSLIVEFVWRSAPPPPTLAHYRKSRWAASSIFYLFSKGYIYVQGWHVDASSVILVDSMRRNF